MPRIPRMYLNTEYFHIMTQGINKSYIFDKAEDIKFYIKKIYELQNKHCIKIIDYCIMSNHVHILIHARKIKNLSEYMHTLNTMYACYYNKKYKRIGYVFRDRYKAEGIYSEKHLYNCIEYIYNNPVKAGICDKPEDYPYSSYKCRNIKKEYFKEDFHFIDVEEDKEKKCKEVIADFMQENKLNLNQLGKDDKRLHTLIVLLKRDYNISLREIALNLKINREKVRKNYKEN